MRNQIKVSVIIPIFNCDKYLNGCLDSLKGQILYETEYIMVNDASTDNSLAILNQYAQEDNRFYVISLDKNMGAGAARNVGLKAAKGEYLLFLDSDDVFEPELLSRMYETCKKEEADISICEADAFTDDVNSRSPFYVFNRGMRVLLQDLRVFNYHMFPTCIFSIFGTMAWNKLYRREFVLGNNIRFQEIPSINDFYFTCTAVTKATKIVLCEGFYVHYRKGRPQSISRKSLNDTKQYSNHLYEAFIALQKRLKEDQNFDLVKDSYINAVLILFLPMLWNAAISLHIRHYLYNLFKEKIFYDLCFDEGREVYFYNYMSYRYYSAILHSSTYEEMIEVVNTVPGIYEKNIDLLNELMVVLRKKSYKTALWGYGERGEDFYRVVGENGCINYIIDMNPEKQGMSIAYGLSICDYEDIKEEVDVILATSSYISRDILHKVEKAGRDTVIIDIEFYLMTRNIDYINRLLDR